MNREEAGRGDAAEILAALTVWTGWGRSKWPLRDEAAVRSRFGEDAPRLLEILGVLAKDFYSTDARHLASDVAEMGEMAAAEFRAKHPELPGQIAGILAWCYTFDFK